MALAAIVDSVDALPEAIRGEYTKAADGRFHLNLEGGDALPFVAGLRTALNSERTLRETHERSSKAWAKLGKTPDEIAEMLREQEEATANGLKKKGDFDGILKQHTDKWAAREAALLGERDTANSAARTAIVDASVTGALSKSKATAAGLELLGERLGKRVQLEFVNGKPVHKIMQADGTTPMAGSGSDGLATYDDLVQEAVKSWPELFEATGAGGGGTPPKGGAGGTGKTIARSDFAKLSPAEQVAKIKTHSVVND